MLVSPQVSPKWILIPRHFAAHTARQDAKIEAHIRQVMQHNERDTYELQKEHPMSRLFALKESCQLLGISRSSVYRLIAQGELDVVYVLSSPRIPEDSIDSYIERNLVTKEVTR